MIKIKELGFSYNHKEVLCGINIEVVEGEVVSIIGPNGAGKTTLLRCINKILKPDKGEIFILGHSLKKTNLHKLSKMIAYVPQRDMSSFPFTVFETVLMGRRPHIRWKVREYDQRIVNGILHELKLINLRNRLLDELSGGERQRVLIARALTQEPSVILLDEPTSSLDLKHQLEVFDLIRGLVKKKGISVISAIHDLNLAARFSDRIIMLKDGMVFDDGSPESVISAANIRDVYEVEAYTDSNGGDFHVVPIRAL